MGTNYSLDGSQISALSPLKNLTQPKTTLKFELQKKYGIEYFFGTPPSFLRKYPTNAKP